MSSAYTPFRGTRSLRDILLLDTKLDRGAGVIQLPAAPYYAEISAWVNLAAGSSAFPSGEQMLLDAPATAGSGWRLILDEHGYLQFRSPSPDAAICSSRLPLHALVDAARAFRVGVSIMNYAWLLRESPYAAEAAEYGRLRLIVSQGTTRPFMEVGGLSGREAPVDLCPCPTQLGVGVAVDGGAQCEGSITRVVAYNTGRHECLNSAGKRSARGVLPVIPGGGAFEPRWLDGETVETFTMPEFTQTSSYWVCLRVEDASDSLRRLRVHTIWHGGPNMTPTFFWSADKRDWRRVLPERVEMDAAGRGFVVEFRLTKRMAAGGYLCSAPWFSEEEKDELLAWAARQDHVTVQEIGRSVEGPISCT